MSLAKLDPKSPLSVPERKRYAWETEETLVEMRRRKLRYRIQRLISKSWLWVVLIALVTFALFDAGVMTAIMSVIPYLLRFVVTASAVSPVSLASCPVMSTNAMPWRYPISTGRER